MTGSIDAQAIPTSGAPVIHVADLTKRYGRTLALDGVSLDVLPNELFALLGPNGAGKTTLLHILCTILRPDSGVAQVAGFDVLKKPLQARRHLGVVFQEPSLDDRLTVWENLNFHGLVYQVPWRERHRRIDEMLELVELSEWRDHLTRQLSGGMKRRLEIARALVHGARIIFMDEPTVGLDAQSRDRIWGYLDRLRRERDLTVVVTTHYIEEVESCDRVCIIDQGKILASGTPDQLKSERGQELIRAVPRDPETGEAIRAAYPGAITNAGGEIIVPLTGEATADGFLSAFGTRVKQFNIDRPSLESVFLSLTGRDLRDRAADERTQSLGAGRRGGRS